MSPEQFLNVILSVSEGSERVRFFGAPQNDGRAVSLGMAEWQ